LTNSLKIIGVAECGMNPNIETRYIVALQRFWHYAKSFSYMKSAMPNNLTALAAICDRKQKQKAIFSKKHLLIGNIQQFSSK
jgi:hypothetical protein